MILECWSECPNKGSIRHCLALVYTCLRLRIYVCVGGCKENRGGGGGEKGERRRLEWRMSR